MHVCYRVEMRNAEMMRFSCNAQCAGMEVDGESGRHMVALRARAIWG